MERFSLITFPVFCFFKSPLADKFKDEVCREAGLKIIRIDYQEMNYPETMLQKIVEG